MSRHYAVMMRTMRIFPVAANLLAATTSAQADDFPPGALHDKVAQACTQCHGADQIAGQRMSRDGWRDTVARMVANGAQISDADQARIVGYLAASFPAK